MNQRAATLQKISAPDITGPTLFTSININDEPTFNATLCPDAGRDQPVE